MTHPNASLFYLFNAITCRCGELPLNDAYIQVWWRTCYRGTEITYRSGDIVIDCRCYFLCFCVLYGFRIIFTCFFMVIFVFQLIIFYNMFTVARTHGSEGTFHGDCILLIVMWCRWNITRNFYIYRSWKLYCIPWFYGKPKIYAGRLKLVFFFFFLRICIQQFWLTSIVIYYCF